MILRLPAEHCEEREHAYGIQTVRGSRKSRASRNAYVPRETTSQLTSQTPSPRPHLVLHGDGDRGPERALPAQLGPGDGYMERDDASPRGT